MNWITDDHLAAKAREISEKLNKEARNRILNGDRDYVQPIGSIGQNKIYVKDLIHKQQQKMWDDLFVHVTTDGKRMFIGEMDDKHLENTIKLFCKQYKEASEALKGGGASVSLELELLGIKPDPNQVKQVMVKALHKIPPYVYEAMLRGMHVTALLQETIGRDSKIVRNSFIALSDKARDANMRDGGWQILDDDDNSDD